MTLYTVIYCICCSFTTDSRLVGQSKPGRNILDSSVTASYRFAKRWTNGARLMRKNANHASLSFDRRKRREEQMGACSSFLPSATTISTTAKRSECTPVKPMQSEYMYICTVIKSSRVTGEVVNPAHGKLNKGK